MKHYENEHFAAWVTGQKGRRPGCWVTVRYQVSEHAFPKQRHRASLRVCKARPCTPGESGSDSGICVQSQISDSKDSRSESQKNIRAKPKA